MATLIVASTGLAEDTIVFKNGDILTGTILKEHADHIYVRSVAFGSVSLRRSDIAEIRPQTDLLEPSDKPSVSEKVAKAKQPEPKEKKQWAGKTGLSFAMRQKTTSQNGTDIQDEFETYRLYGNLNWTGKRNDLRWDWLYRYSRDEDETRDDYFSLSQNYKFSFKSDIFFIKAKSVYQRDYNRLIENEYLQTADFGVKWFKKDSKLQISTALGAGYHIYERYSDQTRTNLDSYSEPKINFDENLSWKLINSLTLIQKYTHLGDLSDYHFKFSAGLENKLINQLFVRVEYKLDHDNNFNKDNRVFIDKALLTSLFYQF